MNAMPTTDFENLLTEVRKWQSLPTKQIKQNREEVKSFLDGIVQDAMDAIQDFVKNMKKNNRKFYKTCSKEAEKMMSNNDMMQQYSEIDFAFMPLYYVLGFTFEFAIFIQELCSGNIETKLVQWLKDPEFKMFYKKVLITWEIVKSSPNFRDMEANDEIPNALKLLSTPQGVLLAFFWNKESKMSVEKAKSFLAGAFDWDNVLVNIGRKLSDEQLVALDEIKTGVKYEKEKKKPERSNQTYERSGKYDVVESMKHNIRIKYVSNQAYKHLTHKSPVAHERKGHWRHYKDGHTVWIDTMEVGTKNQAA